ncbi:MAG TPA: DUF5615 family PIN-like protein [Ktedonobacterales bacterium]|nr:DUF5615 family PIN-like protein [Ktedonobacterales bacterium]
MQLIADEDIEAAVIARLRADGHDVIAITEGRSAGGEDPSVLAHAVATQLLLLTADRDFGDLIFRDNLPAPDASVVLHRLPNRMPPQQKANIIAQTFVDDADRFVGHFTVIDERGVRFRLLPSHDVS